MFCVWLLFNLSLVILLILLWIKIRLVLIMFVLLKVFCFKGINFRVGDVYSLIVSLFFLLMVIVYSIFNLLEKYLFVYLFSCLCVGLNGFNFLNL